MSTELEILAMWTVPLIAIEKLQEPKTPLGLWNVASDLFLKHVSPLNHRSMAILIGESSQHPFGQEVTFPKWIGIEQGIRRLESNAAWALCAACYNHLKMSGQLDS